MNFQIPENHSIVVGSNQSPHSQILQPHQMYINHEMNIPETQRNSQNPNQLQAPSRYPQQQPYQNQNVNYHLQSTCSPLMSRNQYQHPPQQQGDVGLHEQSIELQPKNKQRINDHTNVVIISQQPGPYIGPIMIDTRNEVGCCTILMKSLIELITFPLRLIGYLCKFQWTYCTGPIIDYCCPQDLYSFFSDCGKSIKSTCCINHTQTTQNKEQQNRNSDNDDDDDIIICLCQGGGIQICCTLFFHSIGYSLSILWECCSDCRTSCWNMITTPIANGCKECYTWLTALFSDCAECCTSYGDLCDNCKDCDCNCDDD